MASAGMKFAPTSHGCAAYHCCAFASLHRAGVWPDCAAAFRCPTAPLSMKNNTGTTVRPVRFQPIWPPALLRICVLPPLSNVSQPARNGTFSRALCLYMRGRRNAMGRMYYSGCIEQIQAPCSGAAMLGRQYAFAYIIAVQMIDNFANGVQRSQLRHGERAGKSLVELCIQANPLNGCAAACIEIFVRVHLHTVQQPLPDAAHRIDLLLRSRLGS